LHLTLSSTDGVDDFVICAPALQHASLWSRPLDVLTIGPSSSNPARACMLRLSCFTTDAQRPDLISSCAVCSRPVGHLRCINPILNRVWYGKASRSDNGLPYAVEDPLSRYIFSSARPSMHADSADGGGIRGISSLLILENIMEKLRDADGLDNVPRPCEYFDLIGGTSTGG